MSFFIYFTLLFGATILASTLFTYLFQWQRGGSAGWINLSEAKVHIKETPTMGGVAIFAAYWGAFFLGVPLSNRSGLAKAMF